MFCSEIKSIKKTRKPHRCIFCTRVIPIGNRAYTWFYSWGGKDSGTCYSCHPCENSKIVDKDDYSDDNEIYGDISDRLSGNEFPSIKCPHCESHDYKNWEWTNDYKDIKFTCNNCKETYVFEYGF